MHDELLPKSMYRTVFIDVACQAREGVLRHAARGRLAYADVDAWLRRELLRGQRSMIRDEVKTLLGCAEYGW